MWGLSPAIGPTHGNEPVSDTAPRKQVWSRYQHWLKIVNWTWPTQCKWTCVRHSCSKKTSLVRLSALTQISKPNLTYTMQTNLCQTQLLQENKFGQVISTDSKWQTEPDHTMQTNLCQTRVSRQRSQYVGLWSVFRFLWIGSLHNTRSKHIKGSKECYLLGQDKTS